MKYIVQDHTANKRGRGRFKSSQLYSLELNRLAIPPTSQVGMRTNGRVSVKPLTKYLAYRVQ